MQTLLAEVVRLLTVVEWVVLFVLVVAGEAIEHVQVVLMLLMMMLFFLLILFSLLMLFLLLMLRQFLMLMLSNVQIDEMRIVDVIGVVRDHPGVWPKP